jgi:hypothetical protein
MSFKRKLILACCFSVLSIMVSYAQPPVDDPGGDQPVPISGIEILLTAGGVLGVKRILGIIRKSKNQ